MFPRPSLCSSRLTSHSRQSEVRLMAMNRRKCWSLCKRLLGVLDQAEVEAKSTVVLDAVGVRRAAA